MDAVLGEFLDLAYEQFAAAGSAMEHGLRDHAGAVRELTRLTSASTRYLRIVTRPGVVSGRGVPDWELTAAYMREGARTAGAYLKQAAGRTVPGLPAADDPVVRHLGLALDALAAGGDLLWSHVGTDPEGNRVPRSDWARVLYSEPMALAVTDEVTGWARRAVHVLDRMTGAPGQLEGLSVPALHGARDMLAAVAGTHRQAEAVASDMVSRRDLLRTLPARRPPGRVSPGPGESDAQLCEGIVISARRLRETSFTASQLPGNSPFLTRERWLKTAQASAVISDIAGAMTGMLADRSGALGIPAGAESGLRAAADAFSHACTAWRQVTWMWKIVRTDSVFASSPSTTEAADLALRLGRLLNGNPGWTPGAGVGSAAGKPDSLAPGRPELLGVLEAVHEAADAVTRSATADLGGIRAADGERRLYMPSRIVGQGTERPYVSLAGYRAHLLMNAYHLGISASMRAAAALDTAACETGAPSRVLSLIRDVAGEALPSEPGYELDPEKFTSQRLPYFNCPANAPRRSREKLEADADAVIKAYQDDGLSVRECADRFTARPSVIQFLLASHGCERRSRWENDYASASPAAEEPEAEEQQAPAAASGMDADAPMTDLLNELGIDDVAIRMRAAALDKAASDLLRQAAAEAPAPRPERTAAQLAAMDMPASTGSNRQFSLVVEEQPPEPVRPPRDLRRRDSRRV